VSSTARAKVSASQLKFIPFKRQTLKKKASWYQKPMLEKRHPLQQVVLGKLDIHMQKTETKSLSITLYKNPFKIDQRP
jgi:hypothetical protein